MDIFERFYKKVQMEPNSGCWLWDGHYNRKGYGCFQVGKQNRSAHRVSYELHIGSIPEGLQLDHLCRVRCCVNPDHLEPVTNRENCLRGNVGKYQLDKKHCPQGHPYSGDNLIVRPDGRRRCRACENKASRNRMRLKRFRALKR